MTKIIRSFLYRKYINYKTLFFWQSLLWITDLDDTNWFDSVQKGYPIFQLAISRPKAIQKPFTQNSTLKTIDQIKKEIPTIYSKQIGWYNWRQIDAFRVTLKRLIHRQKLPLIVIHTKPNLPITRKALGIRMGKGRGQIKCFVQSIKINKALFSIEGTYLEHFVKKALYKIPFKTSITNFTRLRVRYQ